MSHPGMRYRTTRRGFLRTVAAASLVTASGIGPSRFATAADPDAVNFVKRIDLGIKPDFSVVGPVLVQSPTTDYLTFKAAKLDAAGNYHVVGTAVIELKGCRARRVRHPGGRPHADDDFLTNTLDFCETYEVQNSTWLAAVQGPQPQAAPGTPNGPVPGLRHFVLTFAEVSFECLAPDLKPTTLTDSFADIAAMLQGRR